MSAAYYRGLLHKHQTHMYNITIVDCYINTRNTCTTVYYRGLLHKH